MTKWLKVSAVVLAALVVVGWAASKRDASPSTLASACAQDVTWEDNGKPLVMAAQATTSASKRTRADDLAVQAAYVKVATWAAGQAPTVAAVATYNGALAQNAEMLIQYVDGKPMTAPTIVAAQTQFASARTTALATCHWGDASFP